MAGVRTFVGYADNLAANMASVVAICTWNRADLLRQTLTSMLAQPWQRTGSELLVVDNASTDDTPSVLSCCREKLPSRWVREMTPGHSAARNRAVDESAGATQLLLMDDDVVVGPASALGNRPWALSALRNASPSLGTVKESFALARQRRHTNQA